MRAGESRIAGRVAVSSFVNPLDQITSLLKFYRQEESCGGIDPLPVATGGVAPATFNVVGPEVDPARIRLPIQKIQVLLRHKEATIVEHVARRRRGAVVDDRQ